MSGLNLLPVFRQTVGIKRHLEFLSDILFCWRVSMPKVLPNLRLPLPGLAHSQFVSGLLECSLQTHLFL